MNSNTFKDVNPVVGPPPTWGLCYWVGAVVPQDPVTYFPFFANYSDYVCESTPPYLHGCAISLSDGNNIMVPNGLATPGIWGHITRNHDWAGSNAGDWNTW